MFVDGDPEKVAAIQSVLPDATYTTRAKVGGVLKRVKPLAAPVVPTQMMASYGDRTTAQKLGIQPDMRVAVLDAPPGYAQAIGALPSGASLEEEPAEVLPITLWFVRAPETYLAELPRVRNLAGKSRLWVIYPKQKASRGAASAGINQNFIRESAMAVGLVDYKICSVNDTWSGMLFSRKK